MPIPLTFPAVEGANERHGYRRHGVEIPECRRCNGLGFADGRPARHDLSDLSRPWCGRCFGTGEDLQSIALTLTGKTVDQLVLERVGEPVPDRSAPTVPLPVRQWRALLGFLRDARRRLDD